MSGAGDGSLPGSEFGAIWSSDGVTRSLDPAAATLPADLPFLFAAGQRFGPYLIVRPLGKGGMGQVYEAEEAESGRRVAIKILGRGIGDEEERQRFLSEGRLAASLSHPNCVYVFGTSEVQGFPVIAMELAPSGTLKELAPENGTMTAASAVDAILQVIAGLDAAAALGILHRDIKPSNCFVAADGRVMIGDFGLSIAGGSHGTFREAGSISGTPGFASPEQLRGEPLDVRSDIYSVGATLFYLLAGRTPVEHTSITTTRQGLGAEPAPPLTVLRPDVPRRLASVVTKCLAPAPAARYASYAALAAALDPFRSSSSTPAPLPRRLLAGMIDVYASTLPLAPLNLIFGSALMRESTLALLAVPSFVSSLLYFGFFEGYFGCGAGKALLNLRVVDSARVVPGIRRALLRALVYLLPQTVFSQATTFLVMWWLGGGPRSAGNLAEALAGLGSVLVTVLVLVALFSPARRGNGFAAVHDRVSGTRVVLRPKALVARGSAPGAGAAAALAPQEGTRVGPYVVDATAAALIGTVREPVVVEAYDDRLHRGVWLHVLPSGTPPLGSERRDLGRATRVRWLSGRRREGECWDAYEAIPGQPLRELIAVKQPWSRVRHWVAELGQELAAGISDGSLPPLTSDRVWIGADDRARLLDWPAGGGSTTGELPDFPGAQRFLYSLAAGALRGIAPEHAAAGDLRTPLPIPARTMLLSLRNAAVPDAAALASEATSLLRGEVVVERRRRVLQLVACATLPTMLSLGVFVGLRLQLARRVTDPTEVAFEAAIDRLVSLGRRQSLSEADAQERELIEMYVAQRMRTKAEERTKSARLKPGDASIQREARAAERALARPREDSPETLQHADRVMDGLIANELKSLEELSRPATTWGIVAMLGGGAAMFIACVGLLAAVVLRTGLTFRALGTAIVRSDGRDASRLRTLFRAAIAWSPLLLWLLVLRFFPSAQSGSVMTAALFTLVLVLLAAGALVAAWHPSRGIQDRIAGTWLVPR